MKRWNIHALGSKVKFLSGGTPSKDISKFWGGEIPWVSSAEMTQQRISDTKLHVTEDGAANGSRKVPTNTVLIVVRGMSLAKEFRVAITKQVVTFNQDLKALIPDDELNHHFLFYYLLSQNGAIRDSASEAAHGTKKIDMPVLEQWPLPLPPLSIQRKIAGVLSAYDDLIENDNRRIAILENMAEEIYREWFVRMRFPGHKKARFHRGMPEGWENRKIGDAVTVRYGYTESSLADESLPKYLRVMDINKRSYIDWGEVPNCPINEADYEKYKLRHLDIVMARMAAPGKLAIIEQDVSAVFASYLIKLTPNSELVTPYYLFYRLGDSYYQGLFSNADTSATRGSINGQVISKFQIILPPIELQRQFDNTVSIFRQTLNIHLRQSGLLRESRDRLLSRLITGRLSVEDLDIKFPPSMRNPETAVTQEADG